MILDNIYDLLHLILSGLVILLATFFLLLLHLTMMVAVGLCVLLEVVVAPELGGELSLLGLLVALRLGVGRVGCHLLHVCLCGVNRLSVLSEILYLWQRVDVLIALVLNSLRSS